LIIFRFKFPINMQHCKYILTKKKKEDKFDECLVKYQEALKIYGSRSDLAYNMALCQYKLKQFPLAMKTLNDIIEAGIRDFPGMPTIVFS